MNPNINKIDDRDELALTQFALRQLAEYARLVGYLVEFGDNSGNFLADSTHKEMERIQRQLEDIPWAMEFIK